MCHLPADAAGLVITLIAASLALRPETDERTLGYRRAKVLAATGQAAALLPSVCFVLIEGTRRLFEPPEVGPGRMLVFRVVGLVGNLLSVLVLERGDSSSRNMRRDALVSTGVGQRSLPAPCGCCGRPRRCSGGRPPEGWTWQTSVRTCSA